MLRKLISRRHMDSDPHERLPIKRCDRRATNERGCEKLLHSRMHSVWMPQMFHRHRCLSHMSSRIVGGKTGVTIRALSNASQLRWRIISVGVARIKEFNLAKEHHALILDQRAFLSSQLNRPSLSLVEGA